MIDEDGFLTTRLGNSHRTENVVVLEDAGRMEKWLLRYTETLDQRSRARGRSYCSCALAHGRGLVGRDSQSRLEEVV